MISGATRGHGGDALGRHLARSQEGERSRPGDARGLVSLGTKQRIQELTELAARSRSATPLYHVHADPAQPWSEGQWRDYWQAFEQEFGLVTQPFAEACHEKGGREHRHRVYSLLRGDGGTIRMSHDYARRERLGREAEIRTGEALTMGRHSRAVLAALDARGDHATASMLRVAGHDADPRPAAPLSPAERHQEQRSGTSKSDVRAAALQAWRRSDNASAFSVALLEMGLRVVVGRKTLQLQDAAGGLHDLRRSLAQAARAEGIDPPTAMDIQTRLGSISMGLAADPRGPAEQNDTPAKPEHGSFESSVEITPAGIIGTGEPAPKRLPVPVGKAKSASVSHDIGPSWDGSEAGWVRFIMALSAWMERQYARRSEAAEQQATTGGSYDIKASADAIREWIGRLSGISGNTTRHQVATATAGGISELATALENLAARGYEGSAGRSRGAGPTASHATRSRRRRVDAGDDGVAEGGNPDGLASSPAGAAGASSGGIEDRHPDRDVGTDRRDPAPARGEARSDRGRHGEVVLAERVIGRMSEGHISRLHAIQARLAEAYQTPRSVMARLQEGYWSERTAKWAAFDEATRTTKAKLQQPHVSNEVRTSWMVRYAEERRKLFPGRDDPGALRADLVRHLIEVASRGGPDAVVAAEMARRAMARSRELEPAVPAKGLRA